MPVELTLHAAASSPTRLYVSGGTSLQAWNTKVFSAPFQKDGGLGEWKESAMLPTRLDIHAMVVVAGRLFIAGGEQGTTLVATVRSAPLLADGSLGPWREEVALPKPRSWHTLVAHGDTLWVAGGRVTPGHHDASRSLWRARLSTEGEARVTRWEELEAPETLAFMQRMTVARGRLYAPHEEGWLYSVTLDAGANWRKEVAPPATYDADSGRPRLFVVRLEALPGMLLALLPGGVTLTADLRPDGTLSTWRQATRLYDADGVFATAVGPGGRVYVLGGSNGGMPGRYHAGVWSTTRLSP